MSRNQDVPVRTYQVVDVVDEQLAARMSDYMQRLSVRRAGYLAATGTRYGAATPKDLFSLPRIYCYGGESVRIFGERLRQNQAAAEGG